MFHSAKILFKDTPHPYSLSTDSIQNLPLDVILIVQRQLLSYYSYQNFTILGLRFQFLDAIASLGLGVSVTDNVKNLRDLRVLIALMVFIKSLHGLIGLHGLRYLHGLNGLMDLKSLPKLDSVESIKSIHRGPNVPNVFMLSNVVRD